jgi:hypothetical protein
VLCQQLLQNVKNNLYKVYQITGNDKKFKNDKSEQPINLRSIKFILLDETLFSVICTSGLKKKKEKKEEKKEGILTLHILHFQPLSNNNNNIGKDHALPQPLECYLSDVQVACCEATTAYPDSPYIAAFLHGKGALAGSLFFTTINFVLMQ